MAGSGATGRSPGPASRGPRRSLPHRRRVRPGPRRSRPPPEPPRLPIPAAPGRPPRPAPEPAGFRIPVPRLPGASPAVRVRVPIATVRPRPRFAARPGAVLTEQISQQNDLIQLTYLRQVHRPPGAMRVHGGPGEPGRRRGTDEERGNRQGKFVDEPRREELASH